MAISLGSALLAALGVLGIGGNGIVGGGGGGSGFPLPGPPTNHEAVLTLLPPLREDRLLHESEHLFSLSSGRSTSGEAGISMVSRASVSDDLLVS